ncbi:MAG: hypothetical protein ACJ74T_15675 [Pyrinomonadaceae bacterium]
MRKTAVFTSSLLLILSLAVSPRVGAQRRASRTGVRLVETGGFHGDEVRARTGETWLGLYVLKESSTLVPSVVKVEPANDAMMDEEPWQMSGRVVSVKRKADPIFLVAGTNALRPGPVLTSRAQETLLTNTSDVRLALAGEAYRLRVSTKDRTDTTVMALDDAKLVLSKGGVSQVIYDLGGKGQETDTVEWKLLWAGDLDGDRKLDLYVQVSEHYNVSRHKLFLSSRARAKQLVREVAEFTVTGC